MPSLIVGDLLKKTWVKIALTAVVVLVFIVLVIPVFVRGDAFRPMLEKQLSTALGRKVTLGHLSYSLLSSSLEADNITVADDPAFSSSPFLQAKSLHIGVKAGALLFSHQVSVTHLTIESPAIQLIHSETGTWNFSSLGGSAATPASSQTSAIPNLTVGQLAIEDGSATVSSMPSTGKTFVYSKVDLTISQFSFANSFPFKLSANLPGDCTLQLAGSAGPLARPNAANTPFNATLQLKHFDPVAAGIVDSSEGIAMVANFDGNLASQAGSLTSTGTIQAAKLKLARGGSPAPKPVSIDYTASDSLDTRSGQISDIAIHSGSVAVHLKGDFKFAGPAIVLDLHLTAQNLPIDEFEQLLPAFGVQLPSGSSLKGGTLSASFAISGPATAPTITGPVDIENTTLTGFDLGAKIGGLTNSGGSSGGDTAIKYLKATVTSTPQNTQFAGIDALIPSIGSATGSGSVSPSDELNFNMMANLKDLSAITGAAGQATTQVKGLVGGLFGKKAAAPAPAKTGGGIPLTITGTAGNPQIRLNTKAIFK